MEGLKVMKFGGTSVGKPERMHHIVSLEQRNRTGHCRIICFVRQLNALVNGTFISKVISICKANY
jgi:aspartokinase